MNEDGRQTTDRMPADCNLELLMARYQQGELDAASALIDRLSPQLLRFFMVQPGGRVDADDLLQETWLRIHKVRHTYRSGEPVLPWFYAIARRVRVDHYRKSVRSAARHQEMEDMSGIAAPPSLAFDEMDALAALLAPLSQGERDVIEMLKVEGMSLDEAARATSSTVGSVKQKVHRAYRKIRLAIGAGGSGNGKAEGSREG